MMINSGKIKTLLAAMLCISFVIEAVETKAVDSSLRVINFKNAPSNAVSIDQWHFKLNQNQHVFFDIRAYEFDDYYAWPVDLNNDGKFEFFDACLVLLNQKKQLIAQSNNSALVASRSDGSRSYWHDPYLQVFNLTPGIYTLIVAAENINSEDCIANIDFKKAIKTKVKLESFNELGQYQHSQIGIPGYNADLTSGTYQLSYSRGLQQVDPLQPSPTDVKNSDVEGNQLPKAILLAIGFVFALLLLSLKKRPRFK